MWLFYGSSVSVRRASTGFVSSDEFDAPWTTTPWRRWSTRSFLQDRRSPQLTLYNVCWISFQTHTSTTVACRVYFITSYTGLTSLNESSTSSLSWSAGAWRKKLRSTWAVERPLHCGYRRQQPTSTISQPVSADCTTLSEDYIWPSGFLCCSPERLELSTDRFSWSVRQFWRL